MTFLSQFQECHTTAMGFASKIANAQNNTQKMSGGYSGAPPAGYTGGPPASLQPGAGGYQQQQQQYQAYPGAPSPSTPSNPVSPNFLLTALFSSFPLISCFFVFSQTKCPLRPVIFSSNERCPPRYIFTPHCSSAPPSIRNCRTLSSWDYKLQPSLLLLR